MFSSTKTFSKKLRIKGALSAHSSFHPGLCLRSQLISSKSTVACLICLGPIGSVTSVVMVEARSDRTAAKAVVGKWAGKRDQHCGLRTAPRTLVPSGLRSCCRPHRLAAESGCLRPVASTAWLSRQPEEGQARLQAVDLHRD